MLVTKPSQGKNLSEARVEKTSLLIVVGKKFGRQKNDSLLVVSFGGANSDKHDKEQPFEFRSTLSCFARLKSTSDRVPRQTAGYVG